MKAFQVLALSASLFVARSALAAPVDNPVLEQNARDAQTLNTEFSNLQATDECQPGSVACIGDTIAFCNTGKQFVASQACPRSQNCFALPSVTGPGTSISCTSEKTALSIFAACGADGTNLDEQAAANDRNNGTDSNGIDGDNNDGDSTVTIAQVVTVSVQSDGSPTTLGAVTQTISPNDASSLFGATTSTSTSTSTTSTSTSTSTSSSSSTDSTTTSTSTSTSSTSDSVSTLTVTSTSSSSSSSTTDSSSSSSSTSTSTSAAATITAAAVGGDSGGAIGSISTTSVSRVN